MFTVTHGIPIYIFMLTYYIDLKQMEVLRALEALNQTFRQLVVDDYLGRDRSCLHIVRRHLLYRRFVLITGQLLRLAREIEEYNSFWSYYLTVSFVIHSIIISYSLYLVMFNNLDLFVTSLYCFIGGVHIQFLVLLIHNCSNIIRAHRKVNAKYQHFHTLAVLLRVFRGRKLLKVGCCCCYSRCCCCYYRCF